MKSIICEASSIAKAVEQGWQKAGMPQNFSVKVLEKEEKNFIGMTKKPAKVAIFFEEKFDFQKKKPDLKDTRVNQDSRDKKYSEPNKLGYEKDKSFAENLNTLQNNQQKTPQAKPNTQVRQFDKPAQTSNVNTRAQQPSRPAQAQSIMGQTAQTTQIKNQATKFSTEQTQTFGQTQPVKQDGQEKIARKSPWTDQMTSEASKWVEGMLAKMNLQHIRFTVSTSNNNIKFHFEKCLVENKNEQKELFRNFAFLLMQTLRYKFKKQFKNLKAVFTCSI